MLCIPKTFYPHYQIGSNWIHGNEVHEFVAAHELFVVVCQCDPRESSSDLLQSISLTNSTVLLWNCEHVLVVGNKEHPMPIRGEK